MSLALCSIKRGSMAATELLPKSYLLLVAKPRVLLHQENKMVVVSLSVSPLLTEEKLQYYTNNR